VTEKKSLGEKMMGVAGVWQRACSGLGHAMNAVTRRLAMLESVRKSVAIPQIPSKVLFSVGALGSFVWLVTQDLIHPIVIYALQLYLTF